MLALLGLGLATAAIWGYQALKTEAIRVAEVATRETAEAVTIRTLATTPRPEIDEDQAQRIAAASEGEGNDNDK